MPRYFDYAPLISDSDRTFFKNFLLKYQGKLRTLENKVNLIFCECINSLHDDINRIASSRCQSKRSKMPPVNVTVMVTESFGVNRP